MPSLAKPSKGAKGPSKPAPAHLKAEKFKARAHPVGKPGAHALPSAAQDPKHLIEIGARATSERLLEFTAAIVAKVKGAPQFAAFGLDAAWCSAIDAQIEIVRAAGKAVDDAKESDLPDAEALHEAIVAAKAWRRRAAAIVSITPAIAHDLPAQQTGVSPAKLSASLRALLPLAGHHQATVSGGGPALRKEGEAILAALTVARDAHLHGVGSLSPKLRAAQKEKGILVDELKRAARAARVASPTDASLFSLSHLRAQAKPSKGAAKPTSPASPAK